MGDMRANDDTCRARVGGKVEGVGVEGRQPVPTLHLWFLNINTATPSWPRVKERHRKIKSKGADVQQRGRAGQYGMQDVTR